MAGIIAHFIQKAEQRKEEEKQRARKFKALVELADTYGVASKDQALTMDVDSLEGMLQGHAAKAAAAKDQMAAQETMARIKNYDAQEEKRAGDARDARLFQDIMRSYSGGGTNAPSASEEDMAYAGLSTPGGLPRMDANNFLEQWGKGGGSPERGLALAQQLAEYGKDANGKAAELGAIQYDPVPGMKGAMGWRRGNMAGVVQDPAVKAEAFQEGRGSLTHRDRLTAAQKTLDRISRIPPKFRTEDDKADEAEARATVRELQGGGAAAGGGGGGDDLWQQFLKSK